MSLTSCRTSGVLIRYPVPYCEACAWGSGSRVALRLRGMTRWGSAVDGCLTGFPVSAGGWLLAAANTSVFPAIEPGSMRWSLK
ncbi:hypothetical protein ACQU0X_16530 [Pseudovibrio ascidiaceicola]|uniref:hypothetical protein n=1 Tax=Pseudovibrio ascidiaceicola TaxID=285279 RepID=UPI003D365B05